MKGANLSKACRICQPQVVVLDQQRAFQMALAETLLRNWILPYPDATALQWSNYMNKGQHSKIRHFSGFHTLITVRKKCVCWVIPRNYLTLWKKSGATSIRHTTAKKSVFPSRSFRLTDQKYLRSTRRKSLQAWDGTEMTHAILLHAQRPFASLSFPGSSMSGNKAGVIAS